MKDNLTEVVFILDRSGSMAGLEEDTIGGFNATLQKQRNLEGEAIISTVLFDHNFEVLHNRVNIKSVSPLTNNEYTVRGTTALLDAIGRSIRKIKHVYADTLREDRPSKVLFIITTDGMENSSSEFTYSKVRNLIKDVQEKYNWEFLFLGANIDAIDEARKFGISSERAVRYHSDKVGTGKNYEAINEAMTMYRMNNVIKKEWKQKVEKDYAAREK
jgi:uncharacterized protein YegL